MVYLGDGDNSLRTCPSQIPSLVGQLDALERYQLELASVLSRMIHDFLIDGQ